MEKLLVPEIKLLNYLKFTYREVKEGQYKVFDENGAPVGEMTIEGKETSQVYNLSLTIDEYKCNHKRENKPSENDNIFVLASRFTKVTMNVGDNPAIYAKKSSEWAKGIEIKDGLIHFSFSVDEVKYKSKEECLFREDTSLGAPYYEYNVKTKAVDDYQSKEKYTIIPIRDHDNLCIVTESVTENNGSPDTSRDVVNMPFADAIVKHEEGLNSFIRFLALFSYNVPAFAKDFVSRFMTKQLIEKNGLTTLFPCFSGKHIEKEQAFLSILGLRAENDGRIMHWVVLDEKDNSVGSIDYHRIDDYYSKFLYGFSTSVKTPDLSFYKERTLNKECTQAYGVDLIKDNERYHLIINNSENPSFELRHDGKTLLACSINDDNVMVSFSQEKGKRFCSTTLNYTKGEEKSCTLEKTWHQNWKSGSLSKIVKTNEYQQVIPDKLCRVVTTTKKFDEDGKEKENKRYTETQNFDCDIDTQIINGEEIPEELENFKNNIMEYLSFGSNLIKFINSALERKGYPFKISVPKQRNKK